METVKRSVVARICVWEKGEVRREEQAENRGFLGQ